jgi:beta-glucosidase
MIENSISKAVYEAKRSDYIILCLGETSYTEKPGDLNDLKLHDLQIKLANELSKADKPIILILNQGRPRLITDIQGLMKGIINIYLPGNLGGNALADIVSGVVNPSGKLPYTYPAYPNSLIPYYYKPSEVQNNSQGAYNYVGKVNNLYDFGYGLSYSDFSYSNFNIDKTEYSRSESIKVSIDVTNNSDIDGKETIQLYTSDLYASITPDNKRLRDFKKIKINAGMTKTIEFILPVTELSFINSSNKSVVESGVFNIKVGDFNKDVTIK